MEDKVESPPAQGPAFPSQRRRSSSYGTYSRLVCVAVDGSIYSRLAFDWYIANVWRNEDMVVFLHCPEPPRLPTFSFKTGLNIPVDDWKKILDEVNSHSRQIEEDYSTVCMVRKIKHKMKACSVKNPGEGILQMANEEEANLIVMGSKGCGESKLGKRGLVAEYVSRHSSVPVLVVPCGSAIEKSLAH